jgi:hypothetical protein
MGSLLIKRIRTLCFLTVHYDRLLLKYYRNKNGKYPISFEKTFRGGTDH